MKRHKTKPWARTRRLHSSLHAIAVLLAVPALAGFGRCEMHRGGPSGGGSAEARPPSSGAATSGASATDAGGGDSARIVLPMHRVGGRPGVDVEIDGRGPFRFILDTGAMTHVIDSSLAAELELTQVGETELKSPAGQGITATVVSIGALSAGNVTAPVEAATLDFVELFGSSDAPKGVLGLAFFSGQLVSLDFAADTIVLESGALPPENGADIFAYQAGQIPTVPLMLGEHEVRAHLDTGAPSMITLPLGLAETLPLEGELVQTGMARTVDAVSTISSARLAADGRIGQIVLPTPELQFSDRSTFATLGVPFLSRFVTTLDPAHHRLRLTPAQPAAGGTEQAAKRKRYGMKFHDFKVAEPQVVGVERESIADDGGIRAGDRIIELNGVVVSEMDMADRIAAMRGSPLTVLVERGGERIPIELRLDS